MTADKLTADEEDSSFTRCGAFKGPNPALESNAAMATRELDDAMLGVGASVNLIDQRLLRLERAVTLLARHVGATGWNKPLQEVLDAIQADVQAPW